MIPSRLQNRLLLILIIVIVAPLYLYQLSSIPTNITGDENTFLTSVYEILFGPKTVSPFTLMGDGTQPAISFYFMATSILLVGVKNAVFGMRLTTVIFSIGSLLMFYILLKKNVSSVISFFTTILLGTSVWYLNFSRNGFINTEIVFYGLGMIYFLEEGFRELKLKLFAIAGFLGGLCFYGYLAGKIYPFAAISYLIFHCIINRKLLGKMKSLYLVFCITLLLTVIPFLLVILNNKELFLKRPFTVFIFKNLSSDNHVVNTNLVLNTLITQSIDTIKGLVLIDGSVIGKGYENPRYYPLKIPAVDPFIKVLFLPGLILFLVLKPRGGLMWFTYFLTLATVGVCTVDSPNLNRTITVLPFIYFISGLVLHELIKIVKTRMSTPVLTLLLFIMVFFISFNNVSSYFSWIQSPATAQARQPAIEYGEFHAWQDYQIERIKNKQYPITNYEWYVIRPKIIQGYNNNK